MAENTVINIEKGVNPPPNENRLRIWLRIIGETRRTEEALRLLRQRKTGRRVKYIMRDESTEDIDRLLDAYASGTLTDADRVMLKMIAPEAYK